ncbi:cell fate (sporulation/competence/biofilm development) regulator YlbF (YheA/YmcA/DUF963 family) [Desulfitispora alkaliphila]|uniref:YlbF family regulator n=1 Tax=Desulfitispora alkaliphila TaxID=622674 RepID=UPI003D198756
MSVIEQAKTLGAAIASSPELEQLKNAEARMTVDPTAGEIIQEFQQKQQELQQLQMQGKELTEEQKQAVESLEAKMQGNDSISSYMKAQQDFEQLLQQVNTIISSAISGDQGCSDSSCGSGCSGC